MLEKLDSWKVYRPFSEERITLNKQCNNLMLTKCDQQGKKIVLFLTYKGIQR